MTLCGIKMIDYDDFKQVITLLESDQAPEKDNRDRVREEHYFVEKKDGQWEPNVIKGMKGQYRGTFDKTGPVIDQICGELSQSSFSIRVRPAGGDSTKETAKTMDGMIRNIENMSGAEYIYNSASRDVAVAGLGGWEVVQDWADTDGFEQDLFIRPISDYANRVWFDQSAERPDMSDANHVHVLQNMGKNEYEKRWPDASKISIGSERSYDAYQDKPDSVTVGRILYKKPIKKNIVRMSDMSVHERTDDFESIVDDLAARGITIADERTIDSHKVYSRLYDGGDWLGEPEETVFEHLPVVPMFGKFRISDGKVIYSGAVGRLMDGQRGYNYTKSREVNDVALAPRAKYWATPKQVAGHTDTIRTLNTNNDPVQLFNVDKENPGPPQQNGGAAINQGLMALSQSMANDIQVSSGLFAANSGDIQAQMSGVAIQSLQNKGDNSTYWAFEAREIAICQTARILIGAIPDVYSGSRQVRILGENGAESMEMLQSTEFDAKTNTMVTLNDLSKGKYDFVCDVGPAFKNRQQEAVTALQEATATMPIIGELSSDIILSNMTSPGLNEAAERVRAYNITRGIIPEDQLTDDEKQKIAEQQQMAAQQQQEPTPEQLIANAEIGRVQAETQDVISKTQEREGNIILKADKQRSDQEMEQLKLMMHQQAQQAAQQQQNLEAMMKGHEQVFTTLKIQAETLTELKNAMGVDAALSPDGIKAYENQVGIISDSQDAVDGSSIADI